MRVCDPEMREMCDDIGKVVPACAKITHPVGNVAYLFLVVLLLEK